ncbi:MAG: Hpt domain-containing protein [Holophagaceae bacterium]|nr:Hpt domain-containing protein [Holophagaceae bacterium]
MPHIPNDDAFCSIPVLDAETLEQLIEIDGGELGLTTEMFGLFLADQPKRLSLLKGAIESNDITSIMEISHAIKGSAGTMGALRLRSVAAVLEGFGKGQVIETTPSHLFGCLESAYIEARDALEKHINKP